MSYKTYILVIICSILSFGAGQCCRSQTRFVMRIPRSGEKMAMGFMSNMTKLELLNKIYAEDKYDGEIESYNTDFGNWGMVDERIILSEHIYGSFKAKLCFHLLHDRLWQIEIIADPVVIKRLEESLANEGDELNNNIAVTKKDNSIIITDKRFWDEYTRYVKEVCGNIIKGSLRECSVGCVG